MFLITKSTSLYKQQEPDHHGLHKEIQLTAQDKKRAFNL